MSQKVRFYIKTDIIGSKIIFDDLPEDKAQSAIDKFITKNIEFFKKYQIKPIKEEGDGVLFEGDDLSVAIQACLELSRESQINPITAYAEDKSISYRFALKMFIVTGMVNVDKPYDLLLSRLSAIEKAVQYPENSVILDKATFELAVSHFKNNRIVYKFIEIETDTGKDSVVNIGYSQQGLAARKPQSLDLANKYEKLRDEVDELKNEKKLLQIKITSQLRNKIAFLAIIAVISLVFVFFAYSFYDIQVSLEKQLYDNQYKAVRSSIINKIQSFIDSAHVLENTINLGYSNGQNKTEFISQKMDELKKSELYKRERVPITNSLYFYIMSPHPNCQFLLYSHVEYMKRENGLDLEACEGDLDLFLTSNYPSTGTGDFTNGLVQKIWLGNDDAKNDLISTIAIDWDRFSTEIRQSDITLPNTRFVLVDKDDFVVMDCSLDDCQSMHEYAKLHGPITSESRYVKFDSNRYVSLDEHQGSLSFRSNEFNTYDRVRVSILDGWTLHMYIDNDSQSVKMPLFK